MISEDDLFMTIYENFFKKHKKNGGFTLVEVIVVLVILAILMAIAIPALTGYIDKAAERKAMAEARTFLTALQTVATEAYTTTNGDPVYGTIETTSKVRIGPWTGSQADSITTDKTYIQTVNDLTKANYKPSNFTNASTAAGKITFSPRANETTKELHGTATVFSFVYKSDDDHYISYNYKTGFKAVDKPSGWVTATK